MKATEDLIRKIQEVGIFSDSDVEAYNRKQMRFLTLGKDNLEEFARFNNADVSNDLLSELAGEIDKLYRIYCN